MQIDIYYASKYGATKQISEIIKKRLESSKKYTPNIHNLQEVKSVQNAQLNIVLTPIYSGLATKQFDHFLLSNKDKLLHSKLIIFAVALNKPSCFHHTNLKILKSHKELLPRIIYQDVLLGERIFDNLSSEDKESLLYFYQNILHLDQKEIAAKKEPLSLIDECEIYQSIDKALEFFDFC